LQDELPLLLFFSTALQLGLFWAEIHYNAEEDPIYGTFLLPLINRLHLAAYLGLAALLACYAFVWPNFGAFGRAVTTLSHWRGWCAFLTMGGHTGEGGDAACHT
jgi:hypothetical protein